MTLSAAGELLGWALCAGVASCLTLFELTRTFYVPSAGPLRRRFLVWAGGFTLANGLLALLLYLAFIGNETLQGMHPLLRGSLLGTSYLVLVRLKIVTVKLRDEEVPIGLEFFYNSARDFFYRQLNRLSKQALRARALEMANSDSLRSLAQQAKFSIDNDPLLKDEEKNSLKTWLLKLLEDANSNEDEKRLIVAAYLLTEKKSS